jgi:hypothetical protein
LLVVAVVAVAAAAGVRFIRRQRQRVHDVLSRLQGQRARIGVEMFSQIGVVYEVEALVGVVERDRVRLTELGQPGRGKPPLGGGFSFEDGVPLDRVRWVEAEGHREGF